MRQKKPLAIESSYVSRGGLKLASIMPILGVNFSRKIVLDVGSSTGGFTDFALKSGAKKVYAIEAGKDQMHPSLSLDPRVELHEKTDIFKLTSLPEPVGIILIDVSFISVREVLTHLSQLVSSETQIVALLKPQFETLASNKHHGVIKNERVRRQILRDFELWLRLSFVIQGKADSLVRGNKGNRERFYLIQKH